jgi:NADP-dependent 3-hydroxy acid dehydrogenase YdfG
MSPASPKRTAVVTGGGSGVGAAIALALARQGNDVYLVGRRRENLEGVATRARAFGANAVCCQADVAKASDLIDLTRSITEAGVGIDILVHSAAAIERAPVETASLESFDYLYRVNVGAPYALTQALLPMLKARRGDVVFINSSSGISAKPLFAQYDSTKHALRAVADSLRGEVNADGIRVLSVYLGRTASEMQARLHKEEGRIYRSERLLQPEDVASLIVEILGLPRSAEVTDIHIRPMLKS